MLTEDEEEAAATTSLHECVIFDFPRDKLNIVDSYGSGFFGDIHLCSVDKFPARDEIFQNSFGELVVVKSLTPGSNEALRLD